MSRYSTSATKVGSTHVALGFLIGFVSLDFGLTTVSSCFLIWLETVRDHPVPDLAHIIGQVLAFLLSEVKRGDACGIFHEANDRELSLLDGLDFQPSLVSVGAVGRRVGELVDRNGIAFTCFSPSTRRGGLIPFDKKICRETV